MVSENALIPITANCQLYIVNFKKVWCMKSDYKLIMRIIGGNPRFSTDSEGYDIIGDGVSEDYKRLYLDKLRYAAENADSLISSGFDAGFYDFYGVDKSRVSSPEEMRERLIFESFVMVLERRTIECCISNKEFMAGHFIELVWDLDWNLQSAWIN